MTATLTPATESVTTRTLRTDKGLVVQTALTDREAAELAGRSASDFARKLAFEFGRYGGLWPNKLAWLHKLALEQLAAEMGFQAGTGAGAVGPEKKSLAGVVKFLDPASESLKSGACVTFDTPTAGVVEIKRAGRNSKHAGSYWVTDGRGYGANTLYARIDRGGAVTEYRAMTPEVMAVLDGLDADPAGYVARYGVRTGRCCFCHTKLTDEVSVVMGYGGTCAKHYGLPHGVHAMRAALAARKSA